MTVAAHALARCRFDGWDAAGAPEVWALRQIAEPATDPRAAPEMERERMRQAARDVLRERLAAAFDVPAMGIAISHERGAAPRAHWRSTAHPNDGAPAAQLADTGLSISHEAGLSLAAWHGSGPVGVDVVQLSAPADETELARVAQLYLGSDAPLAHTHRAPTTLDVKAFLRVWACHEARLKCAGMALVEWSDVLAARLIDIHATPVELPPWAGEAVAAIAWRASAVR